MFALGQAVNGADCKFKGIQCDILVKIQVRLIVCIVVLHVLLVFRKRKVQVAVGGFIIQELEVSFDLHAQVVRMLCRILDCFAAGFHKDSCFLCCRSPRDIQEQEVLCFAVLGLNSRCQSGFREEFRTDKAGVSEDPSVHTDLYDVRTGFNGRHRHIHRLFILSDNSQDSR